MTIYFYIPTATETLRHCKICSRWEHLRRSSVGNCTQCRRSTIDAAAAAVIVRKLSHRVFWRSYMGRRQIRGLSKQRLSDERIQQKLDTPSRRYGILDVDLQMTIDRWPALTHLLSYYSLRKGGGCSCVDIRTLIPYQWRHYNIS